MGILEVVTIDNAENSTENRKTLTTKYFLIPNVCQYIVEKC